jgi:hypothetical protein
VIRVSFIWAVLVGGGFATQVEAGSLQIPRAQPQPVVVIPASAETNEPIAKLPPPVAPGMDTNNMPSLIKRREPPRGVEISTNNLKSPAAAKKARQEAERERLDHNALLLQLDRAGKGSEDAMRSLGFRYLKGQGVPKDEAKAREWLKKATDAGDVASKKELEKLDAAQQSTK